MKKHDKFCATNNLAIDHPHNGKSLPNNLQKDWVAILFETNEVPDVMFDDEVIWKKFIRITDGIILSLEEAATALGFTTDPRYLQLIGGVI